MPTGVAIALPGATPRSCTRGPGLAVRYGVAWSTRRARSTRATGARSRCVVNLDPREPMRLRRGDRIAQLVVQRVERATFHEVETLPGSERGEGGFGSTGSATVR